MSESDSCYRYYISISQSGFDPLGLQGSNTTDRAWWSDTDQSITRMLWESLELWPQVTHTNSNLRQAPTFWVAFTRIHLSYFKTNTDYSRRNFINQRLQGCWIWDVVHSILHVLWVSDNISKLQTTVTDCVRLWCHGVRIVGDYCDVTVWELYEDIVMSQLCHGVRIVAA